MTVRLQPEEPSVPPVFALSMPRAGSTLLRYLLDAHSRICSPGELLLGRLCQTLQMSCERTLGLVGSAGVPAEAVARQEVRRTVAGMMQAYARAKGKQIWCDKTPANLDYVQVLVATFPEARFICLHRHCLDVVHSCLEASRFGFMEELAGYVTRDPGNLVAALIEGWLEQTEKLLELERSLPRNCHRILYESMVLRPQETLPGLFRFLGVEWEPEILERAFNMPHDEGGGDPKVRFTRSLDPASIGKGGAIPLGTFSLPLRKRMNEVLVKVGYPEVGLDWNERHSARPSAEGERREPEALGVRELFSHHVPAAFERNAQKLFPSRASVKFLVTGRESGTWVVDLREKRVITADRAADCTVRIDSEVLLSIAHGALNPFRAFQEGKVQFEGDMELLLRAPLFLEVTPPGS